MYIQITTRCNMSCAHCCMSATKDGDDMTIEVFKKALEYSDDNVSIGGGEPTLHPKFWEFIGLSLGHSEYTWLATNGSVTDTALGLAKLARLEAFGCELSQDWYHDDIDERVIDAFTAIKSIRDVTHEGTKLVMKQGRGAELPDHEAEDGCSCEDLICKPNGDITVCGCDDAPMIGNIMDDGLDINNKLTELYGEDYEWNECHKRQPVTV